MENKIDALERFLCSKIATIAKLKNDIHKKRIHDERKARIIENKKSYNEKLEKEHDLEQIKKIHFDNNLQKSFIFSLLTNLKYPPNNREYPQDVLDICFSIYSISEESYELLVKVLDLPSKSTIKDHFSKIVKEEKQNITDISSISNIIYNYKKANNIDKPFDIILGIDACSFDRLNADGKKYCFCFYCQPLKPDFKCFPIHIIPAPNGKASSSILNLMNDIITILKDNDVNVVYTASDGDSGYNELTDETLEIYIKNNNFESALKSWGKSHKIKHIIDMLHILKIARERLIQGCITLNSNKIIHKIISESLENILLLGPTLTDKSPLGKMRDIYAIKLFNFENLKTLFQNDMLNETYYFLPYVCWLEAVTNQEISKKSRIDLLHIAYDIFYSFLVQNVNEKRGPHITINNSENSEAKVFADNNLLIRSMNSILGIAYLIETNQTLALDRIGTHVLENYFGEIRFSCNNFDSWENIISEVSHAIVRTNILNKYNIHIRPNRLNYGGVHINDSDELNLLNFPGSIYPVEKVNDCFLKIVKEKIDEITNDQKEEYNQIKQTFFEFIEKADVDKKELINPGPISASHILSRCIGGKKQMIKENDSKRCCMLNQIFQKAESAINSIRMKNDDESLQQISQIQKVLFEVEKLNCAFSERTADLVKRSNFYDSINRIVDDEEDQNTLMFIDSVIVNTEMKRRAIEEHNFKKSIQNFVDSGVIILIKQMSNFYFQKDKRYAFINDLITLLNSNLFKFGKKKLIAFEPDVNSMRNDLYWTIKTKFNTPPKRIS